MIEKEKIMLFLCQLEGPNEYSIYSVLGTLKIVAVLSTAGDKNDANFKKETSVIFGSKNYTIWHISEEEALQMMTLRRINRSIKIICFRT